jgi:hypothetical protein
MVPGAALHKHDKKLINISFFKLQGWRYQRWYQLFEPSALRDMKEG